MTERSEQLISLFLLDPSAMTEQEGSELSEWIAQDADNTKAFIQASLFYRSIHDVLLNSDEGRNSILQDGDIGKELNSGTCLDRELWKVLLEQEATAPKIELRQLEESEPELIQKVNRQKNVRKINKTTLATSILSAAAMAMLIVYVILVPKVINEEVATLTDSVNAQWAESSTSTKDNSRLMTNHAPLMLRKGSVELVFDNNSKVIIESPAEFQVLSYDQIKLNYGRLYVTVPIEALGFIVSTPTTKIIDLGTEFGVWADINGNTELHVTKGKASLLSGLGNKKTNMLVNAGSARRVLSTTAKSIDIACNDKQFIRRIDSSSDFVWRGQNVSLADIVGGGNGFGTGEIGKGVEVISGDMIDSLPILEMQPGIEGYRPVPSNPFVAGVFIPGLGWEVAKITSSGQQTNAFSRTSGMFWGYVFNGAWHHGFDVPRHALKLNNISKDDDDFPAITMHSNLGITFDLQAIRQSLPGIKIKSFISTFGVSTTVQQWLDSGDFSNLNQTPEVIKISEELQSTAEFWVFLDGKKLLQQTASSASGSGHINLPLDDSVRFLTLAITEADDTCMFDWALFANPELILESADSP